MRLFYSFALIFLAFSFNNVSAQTNEMAPGATWQQTVRITGLIEAYDYFGSLFDFDEQTESEQLIAISKYFWQPLRDSLSVAIQENRVNAYTIQPIGRPGMDRIFVKNESISYSNLISELTSSLRTVANQRIGDVIYLIDRNDVTDVRNYVTDFTNYFQNLNAINQFELEFIMRYDESGFYIKPTQIIFGVALYPSRFLFEDSKMNFFSEYENGLGFLIDLTEQETIRFFTNSGVQISGDFNIYPFWDLLTRFNYDYVFYSVSGRELALSADEPFLYELQAIRAELMNTVHERLLEQTYGQIPPYWLEQGMGLIRKEND